jgi:hypothetical protein
MVNFLARGVAGVGIAGAEGAVVAAGAIAVGAVVAAGAIAVGASVAAGAAGAVVATGAAGAVVATGAAGAVVGAGVAAGAHAPSIDAIVTNTTRIIKGLSCFILRFLLYVFLVITMPFGYFWEPGSPDRHKIHGYLCFRLLLDLSELIL